MNIKLIYFLNLLIMLSSLAYARINHATGLTSYGNSVHNISTGLDYVTIQEAINAIETLDGHTILVEKGTYYEHIVVNKSLSLVGANPHETIIDGGHSGNLMNITANNVKISGFTLRNSGDDPCHAVYSLSSNNEISCNILTNNSDAVKLFESFNNTISGNNITNNKNGISLSHSSNNNVTGNNVEDNEYGIKITWSSDDNNVTRNKVEDNEYGIYIYACSNSFLQHNLLNNNQYGLGVDGVKFDHFLHEIDESNLVNHKPVYYLKNKHKLAINSSSYPQIGFLALINSTSISIEGINLTKNKQGLTIAYTNDTKIQNNIIANNDLGMHLYNSSNNTISGNNITNNGNDGIWLRSFSNYNRITKNNITSNYYDGIFLSRSSNNIISGNNIIANKDDGVRLYTSSGHNSISENNIVNNEKGIYLSPSSDHSIISRNNITNNKNGITISWSSEINVTRNSIMNNNDYGIFIHASSNNSITRNNITNNNMGIRFQESSNNNIYGNNFITNTRNVYDDSWDSPSTLASINTWNDDYPRGGNYWSDYEEKYPNATKLNNSDIWDTPYIIDENNIDHYPIIPEFSSITLVLPLMIATLVVIILVAGKETSRS